MYVNAAEFRNFQNRFRQNFSVSGNHNSVRNKRRNAGRFFRGFQRFRLKDRDSVPLRGLLHRRRGQRHAAALRLIRLRKNSRHIVPCAKQCFQ